jgi:hypothetical protein
VRRDDLASDDIAARVQGVDLAVLESDLEARGWSVLSDLLAWPDCDDLASLYADDAGFRSRVVMARHGFGRGEYRYFSYPLPPRVQQFDYRVKLRHGVSEITDGHRCTLGIIFHDAT